ncbi:MAG TPA: alpha-L-arabinofuranosidase B [Micromonosporaceae bacterium]|nr:alpha-L-arabinofuranosidase B [Micromonosporaceae bacterium]
MTRKLWRLDLRSAQIKTNGVDRSRRALLAGATIVTMAVSLLVVAPGTATAAPTGPCDIYASNGTPCVAAHSTIRSLLSTYNGPLYQVRRASNNNTMNIGQLADGFANAAAQDSFCANTTCVITIIYDQTPRHNDLTPAPPGGVGGQDNPAPADALPVTAGGHTVYGISVSGIMGYRDNSTSGIATGSQPEGMYMVTSGTHFNNRCCFDYGNAETNNLDNGNGHMDAIYFGTLCWFSPCNGAGPWVMADLENGLFQSNTGGSQNAGYTGNRNPYVTATLKNNGTTTFAFKDGNAQSGGLSTRFNGGLPTSPAGYRPMHLEGAIILGIGGDNSNTAIGSFFEGAMTQGYPTDAAENSVQANVVGVNYGGPSPVAGGTLNPGSTISLRATTACCTTRYVRHQNNNGVTSVITSTSSAADKGDATWIVRRGLANNSCVSFESRNFPGDFLRHQNFQLRRQPMDGSALFRADATFCPQPGMSGQGTSFSALNFPTRFIRHFNNNLYIASNGGSNAFDSANLWAADVSWVVSSPWTP